MAGFKVLLSGLKRAEHELEAQLAGVKAAIASLRFGSAVSPAIPGRGPGRPKGSGKGKKRKMSAKARKAISDAQKKRWAAQKASEKKK